MLNKLKVAASSMFGKIRIESFIGRKSLTPLWHFLHGYQYCLFDIERDYYNTHGFQEYIEDFYYFHGAHSWAHIIQNNCIDDEAAFDKFYEHLDEYLSKYVLILKLRVS
ncbi:hypothetical protein BC351_26550 [Paenibacillus ferrarius]|uniref:Uncharacterized protein n=1 Tax=Paenibacillus ferrarius TaxID=1469647 RepID=A0A1V4HJE6_9BACL|nr:hypothetical protein BC351_26550 [Paenibacillus ferrarius]